MSTIATSRLVQADVAEEVLGVSGLGRRPRSPDSVSSRTTPSRSRTESSASTTRIACRPSSSCFAEAGSRAARSSASELVDALGLWGDPRAGAAPRSRVATPSHRGHGRRRGQRSALRGPRSRCGTRGRCRCPCSPPRRVDGVPRVEADPDAHPQALRASRRLASHAAPRARRSTAPLASEKPASSSSPTASTS